MKKTSLPLALAIALLAAGTAMADDPADQTEPIKLAKKAKKGKQDSLYSQYSFELGLTAHREIYKETAPDGSRFMKETADMRGVKGSIGSTVGENGKLLLSAEYAYGDANYVGAYMGGNYGDLRTSGLSRWLIESTVAYRYAAPTWNGFALKLGLGYRQLVDNLQEGGPGGYLRTNKRIYVVTGAEKAFQTESWTITPGVEYKVSVWSRQESELESGVLLTNRQKGNGGELSVAFAKKSTAYPVTLRPFARTWHIGDSNVVNVGDVYLYEPKNKTNEVGADLLWRF